MVIYQRVFHILLLNIFKKERKTMNNKEKYVQAFVESLEITEDVVEGLEYKAMMDTDDIIDFSSYEKGKEILKKYDVEI